MAWRRTRRLRPGYYKLAAQQGNASAQYELAKLYAEGRGVPKDGARAAQLFQQAAAQGRVNAYSKLGDLYASDDGDGIGQDYAAAIRWYDEAARNGDPRGFYRLGDAYEEGKGVQGRSRARPHVVQPRLRAGLRAGGGADRAGGWASSTPEQRAQAEALAADWRRDNGAP